MARVNWDDPDEAIEYYDEQKLAAEDDYVACDMCDYVGGSSVCPNCEIPLKGDW